MIQSSGIYSAQTLCVGTACGEVLKLAEPLSFWGGFHSGTGRIVDRHHPQCGAILTGRVVLMPAGRGSSSSSSVLAEAIRLGTAPAAIILRQADKILFIGAVVAEELYGRALPIVVVDEAAYAAMGDGDQVEIEATDGTAWLRRLG